MSPPPSLSPPYPTSPAPQAHTLHTPTSPPTTLPASYLSSLWSDYIFLKGFASSPLVLSVLGPNIDDAVSFPRLVAHTVSQGSVFGLLNAVEIDKTSPEGLHLTSPLTPGETVLYSSPAAQRQGDPGSLIFSDESNLASVSFNLKWGVRNADYFRRYHSSPSPAVAPAADTSIPRSILLAFLRTGGLSLLAGVDKVVAKAGSKGRGVEGEIVRAAKSEERRAKSEERRAKSEERSGELKGRNYGVEDRPRSGASRSGAAGPRCSVATLLCAMSLPPALTRFLTLSNTFSLATRFARCRPRDGGKVDDS